MGIGGRNVTGRLGWVTLRLHDEETISPPLNIKANLIDDDSMSLILGFEDVISEVLLVSDFQQNTAYIIFRRRGICSLRSVVYFVNYPSASQVKVSTRKGNC